MCSLDAVRMITTPATMPVLATQFSSSFFLNVYVRNVRPIVQFQFPQLLHSFQVAEDIFVTSSAFGNWRPSLAQKMERAWSADAEDSPQRWLLTVDLPRFVASFDYKFCVRSLLFIFRLIV